MNTPLILTALQITALGMGIVFASIILLWGLMAALTALTADKEETHAPQPPTDDEAALKAQAAAIAVAAALAAQHTSGARPLQTPPTAIVSAWQLGMRTRALVEKGGR